MTSIDEQDLGNGITAVWVENAGGDIAGIIERHLCNGERKGGFVSLNPTQPPFWTVESGQAGTWDGLTLTPSILCRTCGNHGWIRDGQWVAA